MAELTNEQLAAVEAAVQRIAEFERDQEPFLAAGKATVDAAAFYRSYFPAPLWEIYFDRLKTYEQAQVLVDGVPTVLWSVPADVRSTDGSTGSVSLRQCVDYESQSVSQYNKPIDRFDTPVLRRAVLDGTAARGWLIVDLDEPVEGDARRCSERQP